jgi:hypothetical protein
MDGKSEAFWDGYDAHDSGEKCPYPKDSAEQYDWQLGWNFADGSPSPESDEARSIGLYNIGDEDDE